jgi:hypothetical protein
MNTSGSETDRSIDPGRGTWIAIGIAVGIVIAAAIPYLAIWGLGSLSRAWQSLSAAGARGRLFTGALILGALLGTAVHEGIHALTWMLAGRLGRADISFGINRKALSPFAHAKVPLPSRAYRIGTAMPGLVMGVVPMSVAFAFDLPVLMIFGTFYLVLAAGDMVVLYLLRGVPGHATIQDHPTRWGCTVVA